MIITIDGLSWLGKSYIGEKLAKELGIEFFSTGMLVRFVANEFMKVKIFDSEEYSAVEKAVKITEETEFTEVKECKELYGRETEQALKVVESYSFVDQRLQKILTGYTKGKDIVLDGRFTFRIFPDAHRKYYFQSTVYERAELAAKVQKISLEEAIDYINYRDSFEKETKLPNSVHLLNPFSVSERELIQSMIEDIYKENEE